MPVCSDLMGDLQKLYPYMDELTKPQGEELGLSFQARPPGIPRIITDVSKESLETILSFYNIGMIYIILTKYYNETVTD